jgi:hypothetical protein
VWKRFSNCVDFLNGAQTREALLGKCWSIVKLCKCVFLFLAGDWRSSLVFSGAVPSNTCSRGSRTCLPSPAPPILRRVNKGQLRRSSHNFIIVTRRVRVDPMFHLTTSLSHCHPRRTRYVLVLCLVLDHCLGHRMIGANCSRAHYNSDSLRESNR